jgi:hypothetical protein
MNRPRKYEAPLRRRPIYITDDQDDSLRNLGGGNRSEGVREALKHADQSRLFDWLSVRPDRLFRAQKKVQGGHTLRAAVWLLINEETPRNVIDKNN